MLLLLLLLLVVVVVVVVLLLLPLLARSKSPVMMPNCLEGRSSAEMGKFSFQIQGRLRLLTVELKRTRRTPHIRSAAGWVRAQTRRLMGHSQLWFG